VEFRVSPTPPTCSTIKPGRFSRHEGGGGHCHETVADGECVSVRLTHVTETQPHQLPFSHAKLNSTLIIQCASLKIQPFTSHHSQSIQPSSPTSPFSHHFQHSYCDFPTVTVMSSLRPAIFNVRPGFAIYDAPSVRLLQRQDPILMQNRPSAQVTVGWLHVNLHPPH
jgi:hypothetical protein